LTVRSDHSEHEGCEKCEHRESGDANEFDGQGHLRASFEMFDLCANDQASYSKVQMFFVCAMQLTHCNIKRLFRVETDWKRCIPILGRIRLNCFMFRLRLSTGFSF